MLTSYSLLEDNYMMMMIMKTCRAWKCPCCNSMLIAIFKKTKNKKNKKQKKKEKKKKKRKVTGAQSEQI